jgi:hypothetical protein
LTGPNEKIILDTALKCTDYTEFILAPKNESPGFVCVIQNKVTKEVSALVTFLPLQVSNTRCSTACVMAPLLSQNTQLGFFM